MNMVDPTPAQERERLAAFYAGLNDEELRMLATQANSLTPSARGILQDEVSRRELQIELQDPASTPDHAEPANIVTLRRFRDLPKALIAKGVLDSAGIECRLGDENLIRMDWFLSNLVGGTKLWVNAEDASAAAALLDSSELEGI
ncbi:MAG: hypothetical protein GZ088_17275 [Acidipila sp.]|nr:hypothetical protein [Acidipila sp.]